MNLSYQINVEGNIVSIINKDSTKTEITCETFPQLFLEWQQKARTEMFSMLDHKGSHAVKSMPAHLPTLASISEGNYPINLSTRGIGVLPNETMLAEVTASFESTKKRTHDLPWEESLQERVATAKDFYADVTHFNPFLLGGLEIFEGQTAINIAKNPFVSLLYTGEAPTFPSYQFNGVIQIVSGEDPYYKFLLAARELFAQDKFHIHQTNYPFGYLFYLDEIKDKTPFSRK